MKDAFGGTLMLRLFMFFFILYVAFIAVALNFAKIYRIKNNVINILEHNQFDGTMNEVISGKLSNYLNSVPYGFDGHDIGSDFYKNHCKKFVNDNEKDIPGMYQNHGICVIQKGDDKKHYYTVMVYYVINFPIMNINIPISANGETKVIYTN